MPVYLVTETVVYRVEAKDAASAVDHVVEDQQRDQHCLAAVEDRVAELDEDQGRPHRG
jgi:hypothetical protein